jgi:putative phage-type endonuclease
MIEQGSAEWFSQRLGKVTASRISDVMATTKSGPSASRKNYMMELLCQRLTGQREEGFTSAAMQRGTDLEPLARSAYEIERGVIVREASFILHPDHPNIGASPDGFVGDDGLVEIKNPNTAQHVACLQSGKYDSKYYPQMQCQIACTGRDWCDFVSFDDRLPEPLQIFICRVDRSDEYIKSMIKEVLAFLAELDALEQSMIAKIGKAA